jgi:hypothetical protein
LLLLLLWLLLLLSLLNGTRCDGWRSHGGMAVEGLVDCSGQTIVRMCTQIVILQELMGIELVKSLDRARSLGSESLTHTFSK